MDYVSQDSKLINAAFERARLLERIFGDDIPWSAITQGFEFEGQQVLMANRARGIFKPHQMTKGLISIKTTEPRAGRTNIYDDHEMAENFFRYSLQMGDSRRNGNKYLWDAMAEQQPFIYFHAVAPGRYKAIWPCFISKIHEAERYCEVVVGETVRLTHKQRNIVEYPKLDVPIRAYAVRETRVRLHQASFRINVLSAYKNKCAMSGLPVPELLEAAHITPDSETHSSTEISNGIAMTRLHHRAYDANLLGISPDMNIIVSDKIFSKKDGPILVALKDLHGQKLIGPSNKHLFPDRDRLARRYEEFLLAN